MAEANSQSSPVGNQPTRLICVQPNLQTGLSLTGRTTGSSLVGRITHIVVVSFPLGTRIYTSHLGGEDPRADSIHSNLHTICQSSVFCRSISLDVMDG